MQGQPRPAPGCGFVILWTVLSFVGAILGLLLGGIMAFNLPRFFGAFLPDAITRTLVTFLVIIGIALVTSGAVSGGAQWLVLRHQIGMTPKWIGATALGWTGWGILLLLGFSEFSFRTVGFTLFVLLWLLGLVPGFAGAIQGSAQWFVLREHVSGAGLWILISAIAWVLGSLGACVSVAATTAALHPPPYDACDTCMLAYLYIFVLIYLPFVLLLVAGFTGLGMAWLLRLPRPSSQTA